jgi:beta-glucosidase
MTIEKEFSHSPAAGYIPAGEELYTGWNDEEEKRRDVYDVRYEEGVFTGHRWFERHAIEPLYPFGHGLSYATFAYRDLSIEKADIGPAGCVNVRFSLGNTGDVEGSEVAQVFVQDTDSAVPRPVKELKAFRKLTLRPGEWARVQIDLHPRDFAFWDPATGGWMIEPGLFRIHVGSSSADIRLSGEVFLGRAEADPGHSGRG